MMALTPKRLFLSLCISISLLRPYTFFSRSPLVFKTLFDLSNTLKHSETLEDDFVDHKKTVMAKRFDAQRHHQLAYGNTLDS